VFPLFGFSEGGINLSVSLTVYEEIGMAQEHQIKGYVFPKFTATAVNIPAQYSVHGIRGKIQKVSYAPAVANGSIWINYSGTNETVAYLTGGTSGTAVIVYPRVMTHNVSGTSLAGSAFDYFVTDDAPLYVIGSGLTSGATAYDYVRVFYE
jgi:hypothetical protein